MSRDDWIPLALIAILAHGTHLETRGAVRAAPARGAAPAGAPLRDSRRARPRAPPWRPAVIAPLLAAFALDVALARARIALRRTGRRRGWRA